jgi:hypothetical protein
MTKSIIPPKQLTPILLILSWMTYRIVGFIFMPATEAFGGDVLPTAWIIPLGQDGLIGITAPIVVYLLATKPKALTYIIGIAWVWWGITDFGVGLATEVFQPPLKSPFGPHTPSGMMSGWLLTNLALELYAFYLLLTPPVRQYFMASENVKSLSLKETPLQGKWIFVIIGAVLMGIFFQNVAGGMDALFQSMGF